MKTKELVGQIEEMDRGFIHWAKIVAPYLARFALFIVYAWFGFLKIVDVSPANPLVEHLLSVTMPFIGAPQFLVALGIFEILIGIFFLIPGLERILVVMFIAHMATTIMPLFLLPSMTWQAPFVPTLEGQYIIKNVVLVALAMSLIGRMRPMHPSRKK